MLQCSVAVIRDYDGHIYAREWSGGLLAGGFEKKGIPTFLDGIPDKFEFQLLPENWEQFRKLIELNENKIRAYSKLPAFNFKDIVNCGIFSTFPGPFWHIEI